MLKVDMNRVLVQTVDCQTVELGDNFLELCPTLVNQINNELDKAMVYDANLNKDPAKTRINLYLSANKKDIDFINDYCNHYKTAGFDLAGYKKRLSAAYNGKAILIFSTVCSMYNILALMKLCTEIITENTQARSRHFVANDGAKLKAKTTAATTAAMTGEMAAVKIAEDDKKTEKE